MDLQNKVAVITGGASGMGAATAEHLAGLGVKVALLDMNEEAVSTKAAALGGVGLACNVADSAAVEAAVASITKQLGDVHLCINCAGIAPAKRMVGREGAMPLEDFERVINVNLVGTFNVMRVVATQMSSQEPVTESGERGVIVNTASVAAFDGQVGQAAYSASKGGVVSMTLPLARELSRVGIRVMTIAPGIMATPMMAAMPEKVQDGLAQSVTFPKRMGDADEFAKLVTHIACNEYLNGEVIRLDGAIRMA